ncbi:MAG: HEAT repeat domain-containing protein [Pirellulales bacterium]|nr:HEAT repeat domain-containing protein [Pirellulales bacterium]
MTQPPDVPPSMSPDDALPPVEPPNAGFIVQLFVVPAVIVSIIVAVWLMFNWLAHMSQEDATGYIQALKRDNTARWQTAVNLANALQQPDHPLKKDEGFARDLAALLDAEVAASAEHGDMEDIRLRVFLCRALGQINVPAAREALLKTAGSTGGDQNVAVREAAVQALAVQAGNLSENEDRTGLLASLLELSSDSEAAVRSAAAYALGVGGQPEALARLRQLLNDGTPNVRYNAATGLARHGDAAAVPLLSEMLDPEEVVVIAGEDVGERDREILRLSIVLSALQATDQLSEKNPGADLTALDAPLEALTKSEIKQISVAALEVVQRMNGRQATATAP